MENLVTISYHSTHCYLIEGSKGLLLVDAGWPGSLPQFNAALKTQGVRLADIRWIFVTHYHLDHAGLAQEIKQAAGARLLLTPAQEPFLRALAEDFQKRGFIPPRVDPGDLLLQEPTRPTLETIGIRGEVVATPAHSPDSYSLALDSGRAFVGDLALPNWVGEERAGLTKASWEKLLMRGAKSFYPAHAAPISDQEVRRALEEESQG